MRDMNRLFLYLWVFGFVSGSSEMGGVPKVMQWMRLKQPIRMLSSDRACSAIMWAYRRLATAPPAE